jgi:hypothetical protein
MYLISSFPKGMTGHKYNELVNIVTILLLRINFSKIDVVTWLYQGLALITHAH